MLEFNLLQAKNPNIIFIIHETAFCAKLSVINAQTIFMLTQNHSDPKNNMKMCH